MALNGSVLSTVKNGGPKPESTDGGCRVNVLRRPMGAPLNLG